MYLSSRILGANIVHGLAARAADAVLTIGSDRFTRAQLSSVGCFNFIAAMRLTAAVEAIGVRSTRDLFETVPPSSLVLPGIGAIALATLGAAFEAKKIGGEQPLEAWAARHRPKDASREFVTFHTMKVQEAKREEGERKARKARKERTHARRTVAHETRVARFTERQNGEARGKTTG